MGDFNVAHRELDVAAWRRARQSVGFLPQEREWLAELLVPAPLRRCRATAASETSPVPTTWWSWMGNSYAVDSGWRIDYHFASPRLARTAVRAWVDRETDGVRISDHAPVTVDYDF
jgi:exodeoxyribonuclease-3